jgi:hypothetical protein
MKKIALLFILSFTFSFTQACDLCGCNSGNYFIGPYPQFNLHFIGLRYSFEGYHTQLNSDFTQFSNDFYQTTELIGGTNIGKRWQAMAFIPYNFYRSKSDDGNKSSSGLGDITILGNYKLIDRKYLNKDTETVFQQLFIGGGVKIPSGKFAVDTAEAVSSASIQPGTGSVDYLLNLIYSYQYKSWGFNFNTSYRINGTSHHYRFGNRLSLTAFAFRNFHAGDEVTISPNVGLMFEDSGSNYQDHEKVADTGGKDLLVAAGFEIRYKKLALGAGVQEPVAYNISSGQTQPKLRGMCQVSVLF